MYESAVHSSQATNKPPGTSGELQVCATLLGWAAAGARSIRRRGCPGLQPGVQLEDSSGYQAATPTRQQNTANNSTCSLGTVTKLSKLSKQATMGSCTERDCSLQTTGSQLMGTSGQWELRMQHVRGDAHKQTPRTKSTRALQSPSTALQPGHPPETRCAPVVAALWQCEPASPGQHGVQARVPCRAHHQVLADRSGRASRLVSARVALRMNVPSAGSPLMRRQDLGRSTNRTCIRMMMPAHLRVGCVLIGGARGCNVSTRPVAHGAVQVRRACCQAPGERTPTADTRRTQTHSLSLSHALRQSWSEVKPLLPGAAGRYAGGMAERMFSSR